MTTKDFEFSPQRHLSAGPSSHDAEFINIWLLALQLLDSWNLIHYGSVYSLI